MYKRLCKLIKNHSFFLFGPRGSGKTTLLHHEFPEETTVFYDLLDADVLDVFRDKPTQLGAIVAALPETVTHVVIDEIQKAPRLLDEVHRLIESEERHFVMTGSSARKLKRGGANLLAGRAFVYNLFPLSWLELGDAFDLDLALHWGTQPKLFTLETVELKKLYLRAYTRTYLSEEIWGEQAVRDLPPFRRFLDVAAQCNGKIVNFAMVARDVGVDEKTVRNYFSILEDTFMGFFVKSYHNSFRKRLVEKPKFYFFDGGILRALTKRLSIPLVPQTTAYENAFEHFIILEMIRLGSYFEPDYQFSYLRTPSHVEIDLIVERPGKPLLCIEIKSRELIDRPDISSFINLTKEIPGCEGIVLSRDGVTKRFDHVTCYPWKEGIMEIFSLSAHSQGQVVT